MAGFANEAHSRVNEAHKEAYSGGIFAPLQSELLLCGIESMTEISTVHAGLRTDFAKKIAENTLDIRSNQSVQESTFLDIQELLKMIIEQQQRTNSLLEALVNNKEI